MLDIKRFASTAAAAIAGTIIALAQYSVSGTVVDSTGTGEPYATIRIYAAADTTRAVTMGVTSIDGTFSQGLTRAGNYRLSVASVGKKEIRRDFEVSNAAPHAELGQMVAIVADNVLGEVEVVAQKPLVTAEIDRLSYDVASDEYLQTIGALAGLPGFMLRPMTVAAPAFSDEMMLFCGFTNDDIYDFLSRYKAAGIAPVHLKATLTPHNVGWNSLEIHDELTKEHEAMNKK